MISVLAALIWAVVLLIGGLSVLIGKPYGSEEAKSYIYQKISDFRQSEAELRSSVAMQRSSFFWYKKLILFRP